MSAPDVHPAATVVLLRESAGGGVEALMTQRAPGLSFMGGLWVFPGGRVDPGDLDPALRARSAGGDIDVTATRMLDAAGTPLDAATAFGLLVAACRETFEEAGVMLAHPGSPAADAGWLARVAQRRLAAGEAAGFLRILEEEDLLLDVDRLVYWSHWITPSAEKKRFDTRFFAVQVPGGQEPSVDQTETTQHAWIGEAEFRERRSRGEMKMAPPTLATLADLWRSCAHHGGLERMLEAEQRRPVPVILPKMIPHDAGMKVVLPWDPEYPQLAGEGCAVADRYPEWMLAQPSRYEFRR